MNRETWLDKACKRMMPWLGRCENALPFETPLVSVGWPKGHRGRGNAIGQCWDKKTSGDTKRAHIFIAPNLVEAKDVLSTLLHELIHASVGTACGHRKAFRKVALELDFKPPMRSTPMGESLAQVIDDVAEDLGPYPHPGLNHTKKVKVGSRLVKVECIECGCILRMTQKWIDSPGVPTCGCGGHMQWGE